MWIATAFWKGDAHLAKALVSWIKQLDGNISHGALLVADPGVDWGIASECLQIVSSVFQRVEIISPEESTESWIVGANTLFKTAAKYFQDRRIGPWLWLEPDSVPLKKGWLSVIQSAYFVAGKPFFGAVMDAMEPDMPRQYLPGVSCYPQDCWNRIAKTWDESKAFDVATASATVPLAAHTNLIRHFWGQKNLPPTFADKKTAESPINTLTLESINPEAVLWHRSKDMSLMKLLGYREIQSAPINIDLVLPVCPSDARLMLKNIQWMNCLHGKKDTTAVLSIDLSIDDGTIQQLIQAAKAVFGNVLVHKYACAERGWPGGCNRAFQEACLFMVGRTGNPGWFWMEADAVPIVPDWLEQLSAEYISGGKPFGGTVIDFMGHHLNGVSIYPANVQQYCKSLLKIREAWDVALNHEIAPHRHRMNHLIQHCMSPPSFASEPDLRAIEPGIAVFHPAKNENLLNLLAAKMTK